MNPNVRRDLIIGGAVVAFGLGLLGFALFASDENFRAPRWAVAAAAAGFLVGGYVPLRSTISSSGLRLNGTYQFLSVAILLFAGFLAAAWVIVAMGPEGVAVTLDIPLPGSETAERWIRAGLFYGVFGAVAAALFAGSMLALSAALPSLGRTTFIAIVAPFVGLMAWVAIEVHRQTVPPHPPVIWLTFDQRFPSDGYVARPVGRELVAKPGRNAMGLFVGGNGDWIDVDAPGGFDTLHGLTLELWMRRENWINPYGKGARTQQVASVDVELDWKGRSEVRQIAFVMDLSLPRERLGAPLPEHYVFRPQVRAGEARVAPSRALSIPPQRWTHVAVVYDRFLIDRMRLYVDGKQVARGMPLGSAPGFAMIRTLRIGTAAERNGAYRGMVDEVKVYARPLSEDEIAASAGLRK
ncbi:MAG: LamG domain-containing protein [Burkholderiales bacterium]|nr:LamG domain-containing protein [Burkholderiales bacterium]